MSPELVDQAILGCCRPQFLKVARVITDAATALDVPTDPLGQSENPNVIFIARRIKALVDAERLEGAGNLGRWRFSEVRLIVK
jgi:hypothetical protein